jgi:hypothetical protein
VVKPPSSGGTKGHRFRSASKDAERNLWAFKIVGLLLRNTSNVTRIAKRLKLYAQFDTDGSFPQANAERQRDGEGHDVLAAA